MELCHIQREQGLYLYFANLKKARSWLGSDMLALNSCEDVRTFDGDHCRYSTDIESEGVGGQCKISTNSGKVTKLIQHMR